MGPIFWKPLPYWIIPRGGVIENFRASWRGGSLFLLNLPESIRYQGRVSFALEMSTTVLYLAILRHFTAIWGFEIQKFVRNAQFSLHYYQLLGLARSVLLSHQKRCTTSLHVHDFGHINFVLWSRATAVCSVAEHLNAGGNGLSKSRLEVSLTNKLLSQVLGWVSIQISGKYRGLADTKGGWVYDA